MADYRRVYENGGTYFFTLVMYKRQRIFANELAVGLLREAFKTVRLEMPFKIDSIVILPDHLHCIWRLPTGDSDYSTRWKKVKAHFTKTYKRRIGGTVAPPTESMRRKGESGVWQRRFWEHMIRDDIDYRRHTDYIHYNPVKHGLVDKPSEWPNSSFHRFVERGVYATNWAENGEDIEAAGEVW